MKLQWSLRTQLWVLIAVPAVVYAGTLCFQVCRDRYNALLIQSHIMREYSVISKEDDPLSTVRWLELQRIKISHTTLIGASSKAQLCAMIDERLGLQTELLKDLEAKIDRQRRHDLPQH
jgi:hypothetical protein